MQAVILAGGLGTRLSEETSIRPKPMVEIGEKPILWHIMKTYYHYGVTDFIICCGYKGECIKQYFLNYALNNSDFLIHSNKRKATILKKRNEEWSIILADTGENTQTAGRIKRILDYVDSKGFYLTYGDGLIDIDPTLTQLKTMETPILLTLAKGIPRFGTVTLKENSNLITSFFEKIGKENYVNAGYFICKTDIMIDNLYDIADNISFEKDILPQFAGANMLSARKHDGFWHPMDTLNDKNELETMWNSGKAPWKVWKD
jgi:glucose-1-phosphate cytidylyltransferase